jgi:hypothetical protein
MSSDRGAANTPKLEGAVAVDEDHLLHHAVRVGLHPHLDALDRGDLQAAQVEPLDATRRLTHVVGPVRGRGLRRVVAGEGVVVASVPSGTVPAP